MPKNRRDEASAEIAGFNAIVSRVQQANPGKVPTLAQIYSEQPGRMSDFIQQSGTFPNYTYALKPNLTLNSDMSLSRTASNVEAMGQNYFDKAAIVSRLGPNGNSDYANYYGASALSYIAQSERALHPGSPVNGVPQFGLDLARLRLSEKLLEDNGINLGTNQQPLGYYDTGRQPPTSHLFQHTQNTHRHVSPVENALLADFATRPSHASERPGAMLVSAGDQALLDKLRDGVRQLDAARGKPWDDASERLTASTLLMAKRSGFIESDDLRIAFNDPTPRYAHGEVLHLFRHGATASNDPASNRAHMMTTEALSLPAEARLRQADEVTRERAMQQQPEVAREQHLSQGQMTR